MTLLSGKVIVITGSGRGIGAACADRAAALGAAVVINDIDTDVAEAQAAKIRQTGGSAIAHTADIGDWDGAGGLISACIEQYGRIDGLVNNAGLFAMGRLNELDPATVHKTLNVNVAGTAFCSAHAVGHMLQQGSGSIVNVVSGAQMGLPAMGVYGASKGAVASLTYVWAQELAGTGVRVNAVSPMAATRMVDTTVSYQLAHDLPAFQGGQPAAETNAPAVCFMLSDRSAHLNGQVLRSEGRQIALVGHPMIRLPVIERDTWDEDAIAHAFAAQLDSAVCPVGIVAGEITYIDAGSDFWASKQQNAADAV